MSFLLRLLLPSWKFFEDFSEYPVLHYRGKSSDRFGDWQSVPFKKARKFSELFFNAEGNLRMAQNSLLEKVLADALANPSEIESRESFSRVKNWVFLLLSEDQNIFTEFQFQISVMNAETKISEPVITSRIYDC